MANVGDRIKIQSLKHNGCIHRIWEETMVLEQSPFHMIGVNDHTIVIESNGRKWRTKETAICYFYKQYWFNIIGLIRQDGIHFYCNLASPYTLHQNVLEYVDYDLDVKVEPDYTVRVLDEDEYMQHKKEMNYPLEIDQTLQEAMHQLLHMIHRQEEPFSAFWVQKWYNFYLEAKQFRKRR